MSRSPAIAGVVVTYFPDAELEQRLDAISREVNPLIVVDNSGKAGIQSRLRAACTLYGAEFIANDGNRGLASALNEGFQRVVDRGIEFCIAFDQDSTPERGFTTALWATASLDPKRAAVGANWRDEARPKFASRHLRRRPGWPGFFQRPAAERDLPDITCAITSGTLFDLGAWKTLGGFDEKLFLDLVDTEYCLRARNAGHTIAVAAGARLLHRRGAKQSVRRFGRVWWPAFMPPLRLRYLFRNRIRVLARHGLKAPHWMAFEFVYTIKIIAEILFLEDRKISKMAGCIQGIWDGILGRSGRIPGELRII